MFSFLILDINCYFDVILDKFEVVSQDASFMDLSGLRVRKINKTHRAIVGEIFINEEIDDSVMMEAKLYKKQGFCA